MLFPRDCKGPDQRCSIIGSIVTYDYCSVCMMEQSIREIDIRSISKGIGVFGMKGSYVIRLKYNY
jgi:hypothetical protein